MSFIKLCFKKSNLKFYSNSICRVLRIKHQRQKYFKVGLINVVLKVYKINVSQALNQNFIYYTN